MEIAKRVVKGIPILDISGTIILGSGSEELARKLEDLLQEKNPGVILNLENIDYIDSTGIGEMVGYLSKFENVSKKIVLLKPQERILKLLRITKLDKVFKVFEEEEEAILWCERGESNPQGN